MGYEPTNWQAGDTVTSAKLNKIEQGIANGGIRIVHTIDTGEIDETTDNSIIRLDITPNDLKNMLNNGQLPILYEENSTTNNSKIYTLFFDYIEYIDSAQYMCSFGDSLNGATWLSTNLDEYFILNQGQK